jgi:hypothetical protein
MPAGDVEQTCGEELAASAEIPETWSALMAHVAANMETHATWVGSGSEPARREQAGLLGVAAAYREMAASASHAATAMQAMKDLPRALHDPAKIDRPALAAWMRAKIDMQRDFAALITRHADESERALAALEGDVAGVPGQPR